MKLPNGINPAHVSSKDKSRQILQSVCLDAEHGLAYATNGRVLIATSAIPDEFEARRRAFMPSRVAIKAFNRKNSPYPSVRILPADEGNKKTIQVIDEHSDVLLTQEVEGNYPTVWNVIPKVEEFDVKISLNVKFLMAMAKSMDSEVVHLFAKNNSTEGMVVLGSGESATHTFGIIMPVKGGPCLEENTTLTKMINIQRSALEKKEVIP